VNQRSPSKPAAICPAGFDGVRGGEFGDAPPGVPLVDPAADVGFQGGDAAGGEAAHLAGGQLSEPAFHQVQPGRTVGPAGRPAYHRKRDSVVARLTIVFAARAATRPIEARTGWSIRKMAAGYSTAAVSMGHLALKRAIRHAEANDLVTRNVAALADTPKGQDGRPSRSLTLDQAVAVVTTARTLPVMELRPGLKDVRRPAALMHAYIVLSLLCGLRTEEARALRWAHVDLDGDPAASPPVPPHVAVWRSVRTHGETKTERSRRTLALPAAAVQALRAWADNQADERLAAGQDWQDTGLVFTSHLGAALDAGNVRKMFKRVCAAAGIGDGWTPRELRTSFVSLLSHRGVSIEEIARLAGHATTRTTEIVYRRELRPVITTGAEIMDQLFTGS
jgi:integrase